MKFSAPAAARPLLLIGLLCVAAYAYQLALAPAIGLALALPIPAWWPVGEGSAWRAIIWSQYVHTLALVIVSIPFACAIRICAPRHAIAIALGITALPFVLISVPTLFAYGGQSALRLQVIGGLDALKLLAVLPLLVAALAAMNPRR